ERVLELRAATALGDGAGMIRRGHCVPYLRHLGFLRYTLTLNQEAMMRKSTGGVAPGVWPVAWTTLVGGLGVLFATTVVAVAVEDRKSTRLNSSHVKRTYAVF